MPVCNEIIFHDDFDSRYNDAVFLADVFQQIFVRTRRVSHLVFNEFLNDDFDSLNMYNRRRFASVADDLRRIGRQVGAGLRRSQLENTPFPGTVVVYVWTGLYTQLEKIELIRQFEQDFESHRIILSRKDPPFYKFDS
jgi:hypothetical protein